MFQRSKQANHFFHYFVCIKKWYREIKFYAIDELQVLKKFNAFNFPLEDVPEVEAG